jgi:beta-phosphoglucomutase
MDTTPRAVLWDMDGTLIDSGEYHWLTWHETLAGLGVELTRADFNGWFGSRNDRILTRYFSGISVTDMRRIGDLKEERYRELVRRDGVVLLPGIGDWLARLKAAGWRQAVASSAPPANIDVLVDALHLHDVFQAIVSAEEVAHGKPAPDVFLRAAEKVHVPPGRCVVVEDAAIGVEAGRRGGMRTIGIEGGHGHGPLDADVVTRSMADLPLDTFDRLLDGNGLAF